MSAFARMRRGWHLGFQSLKIVLRDKTLLLFPLIPFTTAIAVIVSFCLAVGPDKLFWALFVVNTLEHARYLAIGYGIVAIVTTFFWMGLVACTRIRIDERDSKFMDGILAGMRKFHWVVLWALVSWTIGPILNLLDHIRYTSTWVRKIAKTNWSQLSYFLLPILVVDNINLFSALRRSSRVTTKTWGEGAVSQLGFMWFFTFMNIPTIILFTYGHYLEGPWPKPLTFVVISMIYGSLIIYQTLSAVLSVVLYKFATDGTVVEGFDGGQMKQAFVRPKTYVLVEDDPKDDYEPVGDVAAPESVEPIDGEAEPDVAADDASPDAEETDATAATEPDGSEAPAPAEHDTSESTPEIDEHSSVDEASPTDDEDAQDVSEEKP